MQRRLADWWEGQLKTIDNKQAASEFRSPGPTSESRDSLVHINFEDLAGLNICMAADIVPPPIEPGESIVVLPLDEKAGKLAIKVAPAEKTELDGRILRYRIDFQLASRGDYVAVVERHRERLASPEGPPCRVRAFRVDRTELVPAQLPDEVKSDVFSYLRVVQKERERRSIPTGIKGR